MNIKYIIPLIILAISCNQITKDETKDKKQQSISYATSLVGKGGVQMNLNLPAQLVAYQEVNLFPKSNGFVKSIFVDIGSVVKKGQTLMIIEAPELEQASQQAKEKYLKVKVDLNLDLEHYKRLLEASKTPGAISPFDVSSLYSKIQADSALCNAEKANWETQKSFQSYLRIVAPFDGVITERNVHPGALVNSAIKDKAMLQIKQIDKLRLQFDAPETFSNKLKINDTVSFYTNTQPGQKHIGKIIRRSENINNMRSERIEVDVINEKNIFSSGMYAEVHLDIKGDSDAFIVPKTSVVASTERKYVIVIRNNTNVKIDVKTGNESVDKVEIYGDLKVGESVIINASDEIK